MPKLYFCQPHAKNQGMLRAVLSLTECQRVTSRHSAIYLGEHFPSIDGSPDSISDFAVLRFSSEETGGSWRPGFYRLESDLASVNEILRDLSH